MARFAERIAEPLPGRRPYIDAGTELVQFSPSDKFDELDRAIAEWMSRQESTS